MPEPKETFDQPGIVPGVEKELFMPENVEETPGTVETPGEQPAAGAETPEVTPSGSEVVEPEKNPARETPEGTPEQPGRLYAEKYKTEEELRNAFINLGGNPNRYPTIEKLEEAYEVRQQEFTRSRQELLTQERLRKNSETPPTPNPEGNPLDPEALLDKVDWEKVTNGRELGRELLALMSQMVPKNTPNLPSEQELVERMMPIMQEREARIKELSEIETDIPRLRIIPGQENPFRDAFARHVIMEKQTGAYISLKSSMKNFLNWGKEIAEEAGRQTGLQKEGKIDAAPISDRGTALPSGESNDLVDSIIGSYKAKKEKLGEL